MSYQSDLYMRYSIGVKDYKTWGIAGMLTPQKALIPIMYKAKFKEKRLIIKLIGLFAAIRLYFLEKNLIFKY